MLTDEQRSTQGLIERTLGPVMAQRYADLCDVVSRSIDLRVPAPVVSHMAREFESMLRDALTTPFDVGDHLSDAEKEQLAAAGQALTDLGFRREKIELAQAKLKPGTHKLQIDAICRRIGLPVGGDVNVAWRNLGGQAGRAHGRSYWKSLPIATHAEGTKGFDFVVSEVAKALERQYGAFIGQIDGLFRAAEPGQAVKTFADEIPLSRTLQLRFYRRAPVEPRWITALQQQHLFDDQAPLAGTGADTPVQYNPWYQQSYLIRAAGSGDAAVRQKAKEIIHALRASENIAIVDACALAVTEFPPDEAADLAAELLHWLDGPLTWAVNSQAANFAKQMAAAGRPDPAFAVAGKLFDFAERDGGSARPRFDSTMYAHHAKEVGSALISISPASAFDLFTSLLIKGLRYRDLIGADGGYDHSLSGFSGNMIHSPTGYEEPDALVQIARDAAFEVCKSSEEAGKVIDRLRAFDLRLTDQLALDLASRTVADQPEIADRLLLDPKLLDGYWCRAQYASLARARIPTAPPELVENILKLANSMPERYEENWLANRRAVKQPEPTEAEIADYRAETVLHALFQFRDVLPADVQETLSKSAERYRLEPHISASNTAASAPVSGKVIPFPAGSTGALFDEAKTRPETFFDEARLAEIPVGNLWIVFDHLKEAQDRGVAIVWEPILSWIEKALPGRAEWEGPDGGRELRSALVAALQLIAANLELNHTAKTPLPYRRLAALVVRLWDYPIDGPAGEFPWPEADPAGASFRTVAGLSFLIAFRLAFIERAAASADEGFAQEALGTQVYRRMDDLIGLEEADLCRGQLGMWWSDLLTRAQDWAAQRTVPLFGKDRGPAWLGYVHRARSTEAAARALEPYYRSAINRMGEEEPKELGDFRPSLLLGQRLITDYMLGFIDLDPDGMLATYFRRADDETRARLVWLVWRWVGAPDAEPEIVERGMRFAEARVASAEAANQRDALKGELSRFATWLDAPRLDTLWLIDLIGRIADLGLLGVGVFSALRWLEKVCEDHPDAALATASRIALNYDSDGQAIYGSAGEIRKILTAAVTRGTPDTVEAAKQLANTLEVRDIPGMYDHIQNLLTPGGGDAGPED